MGGCASKPKDLDTRKMPAPAARKPHAPPETPVLPPQRTNITPSNERESVDVFESARESPKVLMEAPATEAKVEATERTESIVPEEKNVVAETVVEKEVAEAPKEETKQDVPIIEESVVPIIEEESVVPKEEENEKEAAENDVSKQEEVADPKAVIVANEEKEDAETVVPETVVKTEKEVAETVVKTEKEVAETVVAKEEVAEKLDHH